MNGRHLPRDVLVGRMHLFCQHGAAQFATRGAKQFDNLHADHRTYNLYLSIPTVPPIYTVKFEWSRCNRSASRR